MTRCLFVSPLLFALCLAGCGEDTAPAAAVTAEDQGCTAAHFAAGAEHDVVRLLRDCGTRTASEAEALLAEYPTHAAFHRPAGGGEPLQIVQAGGAQDVLVCNLSPNRGLFEAASSMPPRRVITGRSCWEFEKIDQVALLGGRSSADPLGDGDGPAQEEWFGVYFARPAS